MKIIKFFTIAALFLGFTAVSYGQNTASETATAGAKLITPLAIVNNQGLDFGTLVLASDAGVTTVAMTTAGAMTYGNGVIQHQSSDVPKPATFTVSGETGYKYSITIKDKVDGSGADNKVTLNNGGASMVVDLVQDKAAANNTIDATPANNVISIGGTLNIAASQALGVYAGEFQVIVAYE